MRRGYVDLLLVAMRVCLLIAWAILICLSGLVWVRSPVSIVGLLVELEDAGCCVELLVHVRQADGSSCQGCAVHGGLRR